MSGAVPPRSPPAAGWRRTLRTAARIPLPQLLARLRFLRLRRRYARDPEAPIRAARARAGTPRAADPLPRLDRDLVAPEGPDAVARRAAAFAAGSFTYLGRALEFPDGVRWVPDEASPLWQYQLQYLGAVRDLAYDGRADAARTLLGSWTATHGARWDRVAWHPYPVSLRLVHVAQAAALLGGFEHLGAGALDLVATHAAFLLEHPERDVRGNHLFENARALAYAGAFLDGPFAHACRAAAESILATEIPEQILPDGGHFEMAPMYHAIVLHGLLEVIAVLGPESTLVRTVLVPARDRMRTFLARVLCPDGDLPLFGDSVRDFGPPPAALLRLAGHVDAPDAAPRFAALPDTGLFVWRGLRVFAVLDAGPTCPDYLPAHGQADTLSVEVWVDGARVVADPGVHDYTGPERAWGRSSRAHSTLTLDDEDHAEVYDRFRVGGRPQVETPLVQGESVSAAVRPFGRAARLVRTVRWGAQPGAVLRLVDRAEGADVATRTVRSRLHLDPDTSVTLAADRLSADVSTPRGRVRIHAAHPLVTEPGRVSHRFGELRPTVLLVQVLPRGEDGAATGEFRIEPAPADGETAA